MSIVMGRQKSGYDQKRSVWQPFYDGGELWSEKVECISQEDEISVVGNIAWSGTQVNNPLCCRGYEAKAMYLQRYCQRSSISRYMEWFKVTIYISHYVVTSTFLFFCYNGKLVILNYNVLLHLTDCLIWDSTRSKLFFCFGESDLFAH